MAHPTASLPSTSTSMLSIIQHLFASAGTHSPSTSRKRKRGHTPNPGQASTTSPTTLEQTITPEPFPASICQHNPPRTEPSKDRESEFAMFLALAGEAPVVKRVRTQAGHVNSEMSDAGVVKRKKKLSVICEEEDLMGNEERDVAMEDIQVCGSLGEQGMWTYRGGNRLRR